MEIVDIKIQEVASRSECPLPATATPGSAGVDLRAALDDTVTLDPGSRRLFHVNIKAAIPVGYVGLICPRSGLAMKYGVTVLNAPGIIDSDYRGEIGVLLINHGPKPFRVNPGERIAQLVITPYAYPAFRRVDDLEETERGEGGFGSTGVV